MPKIIENLESKLIGEARRQIEENGYSSVTIRSVANACGVGVGTFYNYFSSKDDLIATFMLADWKDCMAVVTAASEGTEDPSVVARCIYDQLLAYTRLHQTIFRDEAAGAGFTGSFGQYHALLRRQLAEPLAKFCQDGFTAEFAAEALLTWTMAGKQFEEIYGMIGKLF